MAEEKNTLEQNAPQGSQPKQEAQKKPAKKPRKNASAHASRRENEKKRRAAAGAQKRGGEANNGGKGSAPAAQQEETTQQEGTATEGQSEETSTFTGTLDEVKDFMFIVTGEDGTCYEFTFDEEKPEGLDSVNVGDKVTVTYTGTASEVDPFDGEVISVEAAE